MTRKIIQIAVDSEPETENSGFFQDAFALCDDGSVWVLGNPGYFDRSELDERDRDWRRLPDIPQED